MPKNGAGNGSKRGIPAEMGMDYERAAKIWQDFAGRLGEQVSQVLKERADAQKALYVKWMEFLKIQGVGTDEKLAEASHEYEKLYAHWTDFAEKTGQKVRESMLSTWDERKGNYTAWQELFRERAKELGDPGKLDYGQLADKFWGSTKDLTGSLMSAVSPKEAGKTVEFPKESFENWLKYYTESFEVILKSPAFVALLGLMLDNTLDMKKKAEDQTAEIVRSLGLPSRKDMDSMYKKLHELTVQVREQSKTIKEFRRGSGK
jgi:hypothetical protein